MKLPNHSELSQEQKKIILNAPMDGAVLVTGPPGTGKTVIALYRAALLEMKKSNYKLVMYNKLLKSYTAVNMRKMKKKPKTWHKWLWDWWKDANKRERIPQIKEFEQDFSEIIRRITANEIRRPDRLSWGNLVIDEGQDFSPGFYTLCSVMLQKKLMDSLLVTADENQAIEEHNSPIREIKQRLGLNSQADARHFVLTKNYRNTYEIAKFARHFYTGLTGGIPDLPEGRHGRRPILKCFDSPDSGISYIATFAENNDDQTVGIIVPNNNIRTEIVQKLRKLMPDRNIQTYYNKMNENMLNRIDISRPGAVTVLCQQSSKGLEFDAVFLPHIEAYRTDDLNREQFMMKMYVMTSRARSFLSLYYVGCNHPPDILGIFPDASEGTLEWNVPKATQVTGKRKKGEYI